MYNFISYSVLEDTGRVNFDEVWKKAKEHKPKLIICGGRHILDILNLISLKKLQIVWSTLNG